MKPSDALNRYRDQVLVIISAKQAANPRVFGSVARGEDDDQSDLDLLIDPLPGMSLFELGTLKLDLEALLGVSVDVVTSDTLKNSMRDRVLHEARPV